MYRTSPCRPHSGLHYSCKLVLLFTLSLYLHSFVAVINKLHAGYGKSDEYQGHRISESWELATLIRSASSQGRQVIVVSKNIHTFGNKQHSLTLPLPPSLQTGDFNSVPTSYNYRILTEHAFMTDSWLEVNDRCRTPPYQQPTESDNEDASEDAFIQRFGVTCNSSSNTWSKHFNPASQGQQQRRLHSLKGDRLDYIFYRPSDSLWCTNSCVVMTGRIPGTDMSYSDHFGVQSDFEVGTRGSLAITHRQSQHTKRSHTFDSLAAISHPTYTNLDMTTVQELILLMQVDQNKMDETAQRFLRCFVALVVLVLVFYVTMVVVPYRVAATCDSNEMLIVWLLPLLVGIPLVVCSVLAMVCLLVGFVFGYGEKQAMHQFVTDLQTLIHGIQLRNRDSANTSLDS